MTTTLESIRDSLPGYARDLSLNLGTVLTPAGAPPLFIAVAADDGLAVTRSLELFSAWRTGKGPAELHVFQTGAHGFVNKGGGADHFMDRLEEWLKVNKLLAKDERKGSAPSR